MNKVWVLMKADDEGEPGKTLALFASLEDAKSSIECEKPGFITSYWKAKNDRYEGEYYVGWITSRPLARKTQSMYYIVPLTVGYHNMQTSDGEKE